MGPRGVLFISHAVKDKPLAEALSDLLITGVGLSSSQVFCTSLEGLSIPAGQQFVNFIRNKLTGAQLIVPLLSPNYYESVFCLCELGGSWAIAANIHPLLVPPLQYADIQAVLTGVQLGRIDSDTELSNLRDDVAARFSVSVPTARWDVKRRAFLGNLTAVLASLPKPSRVSFAQHSELEERYEGALTEMERMNGEIQRLKDAVQELSSLKDAKKAAKVIRKHSTAWESFEAVKKQALSKLRRIPRVAVEALYYKWYGDDFVPDAADHDTWRQAQEAAQRGYVTINEDRGVIEAAETDKSMRLAENALSELSEFLENAGESFFEEFERQNGFTPEMANRRFWEGELELRTG